MFFENDNMSEISGIFSNDNQIENENFDDEENKNEPAKL